MKSDRKSTAVVGTLLVLHGVLGLAILQPIPHPGGDSSAYLALAESLRSGQGYRELWDPATARHAVYPPVFPLLLAGAQTLGAQSLTALHTLMVLLSGAAIGATYLLLRASFGAVPALAVTAVLALSPGVLHHAQWPLSDVPFWLLVSLSLWLLADARSTPRFAGGVAAACVAYLTRLAGLPLLMAIPAWLLARRDWRRLALAAALIVPSAGAWWLRAREMGVAPVRGAFATADPYGEAGVDSLLLELARRVLPNLRALAGDHLPELLFGWSAIPAPAVGGLVLAAAAAGMALRLRRGVGLLELFVALYVAMLLVWIPQWSSARYVLPVLGPLLAYAGVAAGAALRRFAPRLLPRAAVAAAAVLVAVGVSGHATLTLRNLACGRDARRDAPVRCLSSDQRDLQTAARRARDVLPPDAVIVSRKPTIVYALSGRRGRLYPLRANGAELRVAAARAGARYVLVDRSALTLFELQPMLASEPERYCVLMMIGGTRTMLLRIVEDAERPLATREVASLGSLEPMRACP